MEVRRAFWVMECKNYRENIPSLYFSCQFHHTNFQKSIFLVEFCFMIFVPNSYFLYSTVFLLNCIKYISYISQILYCWIFYIFSNIFSCFPSNFPICCSVLVCVLVISQCLFCFFFLLFFPMLFIL